MYYVKSVIVTVLKWRNKTAIEDLNFTAISWTISWTRLMITIGHIYFDK